MSTTENAERAALARLWPLIEKATKDYVFTADKAGEVAADMNTIRAYLAAPSPASTEVPRVTDEMVIRFLGWPLPKTFSPDCGISFDGRKDDEWNKNKTWPVGTNLFTAEEARAMLQHVLAPSPAEVPAWRPIETAPLDGTLVRLLVRFDHNAIEDTTDPTVTIGSHNDGEWNFVGWCWHTDEWARGSGDLLGWLPLLAPSPAEVPAEPVALTDEQIMEIAEGWGLHHAPSTAKCYAREILAAASTSVPGDKP